MSRQAGRIRANMQIGGKKKVRAAGSNVAIALELLKEEAREMERVEQRGIDRRTTGVLFFLGTLVVFLCSLVALQAYGILK